MENEFFDKKRFEELELYKDGKVDQIYYNAYNMYSIFFLKYVDRMILLSKYDIELRKNDLHIKYKKDNFNFFEERSYLKYFHLLNPLHIEYLSKEQIKYLSDIYLSNNYTYNSDIIHLIEDTYLKVLKSNELLLGINYDLNLKNIANRDIAFKTQQAIDEMITRLENDSKQILKIKIIKKYPILKENH